MTDKYERLAAALAKWQQDDPEAYERVWLGHGAPNPPGPEAMLTDDPDLWLATAELADPCHGDCEGVCQCD